MDSLIESELDGISIEAEKELVTEFYKNIDRKFEHLGHPIDIGTV